MDHQQGLVVGVGSGVRPIEAPSNHCFVIDYGELLVQFVSAREAGGADALCLQWF